MKPTTSPNLSSRAVPPVVFPAAGTPSNDSVRAARGFIPAFTAITGIAGNDSNPVMTSTRHPSSVGTDSQASNRPAQSTIHIPRGYAPDHDEPTEFVVRCSECGRLVIQDSRGQAHRRASTHALQCNGSAGVTPVSTIDDREEPDDADDALELDAGDVDPRRVDLTDARVSVTYRSIQGRSGHQRRCVNVDRMLPATLDEERRAWRGFEATAENGATLRVTTDHDDPVVEVCYGDACRLIGTLDSVQPTTVDTGAAVATDGGQP